MRIGKNPKKKKKRECRTFTPKLNDVLSQAREVLEIEAAGILGLVDTIDENFYKAAQWIYENKGRVIVTGIGKSGIVGRKIVATFCSTGTPALFLHPVEAQHGDLGMVLPTDIIIALSNSGETEELNSILPTLKELGTPIIAMTGNPESTLAKWADLVLYSGVEREACPLGLAPTASTTAMLAVGDALAVVLLKIKNFRSCDFQRFHPGGHLGERLKVSLNRVMRMGDAVPKVFVGTAVYDALHEMDEKQLGATLVVDNDQKLRGIITDGDLRRGLLQHEDLSGVVVDELMTKNPKCIQTGRSVAEALEIMERHLITVLPIVDEKDELLGILHLHDLLGKGKIRFSQ